MQVTSKSAAASPKPKKKTVPGGPSLHVSAFVDLMKRLETIKGSLTNDQVRFLQSAIQRFELEPDGQVKTKLAISKPRKPKASRRSATSIDLISPSTYTKNLVERLVALESEEEAVSVISRLPAADAEKLAREQGLRAASPEIAREKLVETIITLRQIERIAGAGTHTKPVGEREPNK